MLTRGRRRVVAVASGDVTEPAQKSLAAAVSAVQQNVMKDH